MVKMSYASSQAARKRRDEALKLMYPHEFENENEAPTPMVVDTVVADDGDKKGPVPAPAPAPAPVKTVVDDVGKKPTPTTVEAETETETDIRKETKSRSSGLSLCSKAILISIMLLGVFIAAAIAAMYPSPPLVDVNDAEVAETESYALQVMEWLALSMQQLKKLVPGMSEMSDNVQLLQLAATDANVLELPGVAAGAGAGAYADEDSKWLDLLHS